MGTTTSPQQQTSHTGADKDSCEVVLNMLNLRLFTTKSHYFMTRSFVIPQFTTHVYQAKCKTNPLSLISFKDKGEHCLKIFSFRNIYTTVRDHPIFRAVSLKTKLNSQRD